jgi:hypothetical protein
MTDRGRQIPRTAPRRKGPARRLDEEALRAEVADLRRIQFRSARQAARLRVIVRQLHSIALRSPRND